MLRLLDSTIPSSYHLSRSDQYFRWYNLVLCSAAGVSFLGTLFRIWQLRQRLSFLKSSYDPRSIKGSFIMWQGRRKFVFYLKLFGSFVAYQVIGCAIKSSALTVSRPVPMIYQEVFIYSARYFHLLRVSALPQCFAPLIWKLCYVVRRIHDQLVVFHLVLLLFHIFFLSFFPLFSSSWLRLFPVVSVTRVTWAALGFHMVSLRFTSIKISDTS